MHEVAKNSAIWARSPKWRSMGPREKTLQDFICEHCGAVHRWYVTVGEMDRLGRCACGGAFYLKIAAVTSNH
jgi:hypothetical protein